MKLQGLRNTLRRIAAVAAAAVTSAAVAVSCTESGFGDLATEGSETQTADEIIIAVPELSAPGVSTRVVMADDTDNPQEGDEIHLQWSAGDTFSLWATGETDNVEYKNIRFLYKGSKYTEGVAYFASNDIPKMDEGTYIYRAFAPCPDEENVDRENNRIYYDIPVRQSGSYDNGRLDIMSSTQAVRSSALVRDFYNREMDITFRHETHALKITIPADRNRFGQTIERIRIEFPQPVAGKLAFDAATGEVNTEGITENFVDVVFDEPVAADESCTFWVFIAPTTINGEVRFTAYGGGGERYQSDPTVAAQGAFTVLAKGVVTPVKLTVAEGFTVTWFEYEVLDKSRVGEPVQTLNFTLPSGLRAADRSEDENGIVRVPDNGEGKFNLSIRTQELRRYLRDNEPFSLQPKFESEHTLIPPYTADLDKFDISDDNYTADAHNEFTIEHVPYLFEEDFQSITPFAINDVSSSTIESSNALNATSLDGNGLIGWTGAKLGVGGSENIAMRVAVRIESWGLLSTTIHHGRVDSAPLSRLKDDARVRVNVKFDYSLDISGNFTPRFAYGYHTEQGPKNAGSGTGTKLSGTVVESDITGSDGSYDWIAEHSDFFIEDCTSQTRLAWEAYGDSSNAAGNANGWVYIDNIIVQIANE